MISGRSQENSYTVITWNPESNCTCRKKNHFPFQWNTLTRYPNDTHILGCFVGEKYWRLLERGWRKRIVRHITRFLLLKEKPPEGHTLSRGETYEETNKLSSWRCVARCVAKYVRCSEKESKAKMGDRETKARQCQKIERNILHWAKRRRIQAHNESRSKKVGSSDASSNALQKNDKKKTSGETHRNIGKRKTKYACVVDADECPRPRLEGAGHKPHQDHIPAKGRIQKLVRVLCTNSFRCLKNQKKNPDAKAAVHKEWEKLESIPEWMLTKVRNKKEVIEEARNKCRKVHFASLMDLCHLKNSELEPQYKKYKGSVVLRGDIVKDDSGSYAVFTEQGPSASKMTAAEVMDIKSRLPRCSGQATDAVSAFSPVKMEDATTLFENSKNRNVQIFGYVYRSTNGQNHGPVWKTQLFLSNGICTVTFWQDYYGKGNLRKFCWNTFGEKF